MNRPTGPAPTTNTWVSVAIGYPFVLAMVSIQRNERYSTSCSIPVATAAAVLAVIVVEEDYAVM